MIDLYFYLSITLWPHITFNVAANSARFYLLIFPWIWPVLIILPASGFNVLSSLPWINVLHFQWVSPDFYLLYLLVYFQHRNHNDIIKILIRSRQTYKSFLISVKAKNSTVVCKGLCDPRFLSFLPAAPLPCFWH